MTVQHHYHKPPAIAFLKEVDTAFYEEWSSQSQVGAVKLTTMVYHHLARRVIRVNRHPSGCSQLSSVGFLCVGFVLYALGATGPTACTADPLPLDEPSKS